jgi:hypothetical protein
MLSELLFERQAFHVVSHVISRLFLNKIDYVAFNGLLNISTRLLMIRRRYYRVMRHKLIEIIIQRLRLLVKLVKNRTLLILLSVFNDVKGGCFRAVSIVISKGLAYFRERLGLYQGDNLSSENCPNC